MTLFALAAAALTAALGTPQQSSVAVGVHPFGMTDESRRDALSPAHVREWRVDLYYPALQGSTIPPRPYASNPQLIDRLANGGYYGVAATKIRAWEKTPGPALLDAPAAVAGKEAPLVIIAPGSGVAAFNYSKLAAAFVRRGYVVAVVDLPYVGISQVADGRFLDSGENPIQQKDDPLSWRPRVSEWSADVSRVLDRLLSTNSSVLPEGMKIDPRRIVVTGHSIGGTVALQVCHDDRRVEGCGDFEGAPMASDTFEQGSHKPLFVTAARSAKPDRPFSRPDLGDDFWSYLKRGGPSNWAIAITRASHMSYSDAPFEMPDTLSRFGGELMTPERSFEVYVGLVDSFARAYAPGGGGDDAFAAYLDGTPEVLAQRNVKSPDR